MTVVGLSCSYCKQDNPHPSQKLDWLSEDLDGIKAKTKEQSKTLTDFGDPKPKTDMVQTMDIDGTPFSKLQIGQDNQKDKPLEVTESLVSLPPAAETSRTKPKTQT